MMRKKVGLMVKAYRESLGLKQYEFGAKIGVTDVSIGLIETGKVSIFSVHTKRVIKECMLEDIDKCIKRKLKTTISAKLIEKNIDDRKLSLMTKINLQLIRDVIKGKSIPTLMQMKKINSALGIDIDKPIKERTPSIKLNKNVEDRLSKYFSKDQIEDAVNLILSYYLDSKTNNLKPMGKENLKCLRECQMTS